MNEVTNLKGKILKKLESEILYQSEQLNEPYISEPEYDEIIGRLDGLDFAINIIKGVI